MSNTPYIQLPTWDTANLQVVGADGSVTTESLPYLPQAQFNALIQQIQQKLASVSGQGGSPANINGPLNMNGNTITGLQLNDPPEPSEALSYSEAQSLYASFRQVISTQTSNYTIQATDGTIKADATSGALTLTLPDATTVKAYIFIVVKIDSSSNHVTLAAKSGQTISGNGNPITAQWGRLWVQSDGSGWLIVAS